VVAKASSENPVIFELVVTVAAIPVVIVVVAVVITVVVVVAIVVITIVVSVVVVVVVIAIVVIVFLVRLVGFVIVFALAVGVLDDEIHIFSFLASIEKTQLDALRLEVFIFLNLDKVRIKRVVDCF